MWQTDNWIYYLNFFSVGSKEPFIIVFSTIQQHSQQQLVVSFILVSFLSLVLWYTYVQINTFIYTTAPLALSKLALRTYPLSVEWYTYIHTFYTPRRMADQVCLNSVVGGAHKVVDAWVRVTIIYGPGPYILVQIYRPGEHNRLVFINLTIVWNLQKLPHRVLTFSLGTTDSRKYLLE